MQNSTATIEFTSKSAIRLRTKEKRQSRLQRFHKGASVCTVKYEHNPLRTSRSFGLHAALHQLTSITSPHALRLQCAECDAWHASSQQSATRTDTSTVGVQCEVRLRWRGAHFCRQQTGMAPGPKMRTATSVSLSANHSAKSGMFCSSLFLLSRSTSRFPSPVGSSSSTTLTPHSNSREPRAKHCKRRE